MIILSEFDLAGYIQILFHYIDEFIYALNAFSTKIPKLIIWCEKC
jgi:hypothetical protein